jgi:phage-related tail fiber protein
MQQDDEYTKNDVIVKGLEDKIKKLEDSLKEKDELLCSAEGSLVEVQAQNKELGKELADAQTLLEETSSRFNHESEALKMTLRVEADKNTKLSEVLRALKERCFNFASQCTTRLKSIFNSVGAASEEAILSTKDIPGALECVEKEVDALDEVITGHGDFYALVASRGTTVAFIKAGCKHARAVNRPNFSLSSLDLVDVPIEARSIENSSSLKFGLRANASWLKTKPRTCLTKYSSLPLFFYINIFLTQ